MARNLISQSAYARQAGITQQYVNRLIQRGVIAAYGRRRQVDPVEADRERARQIAPRMKHMSDSDAVIVAEQFLVGPDMYRISRMPVCAGCGGRFGSDIAAELGSPNPERFCCDRCAADVAAGLTPAAIAERRETEAEQDELPVQ